MSKFLLFLKNFLFIPAVVAAVGGALFLYFYPFYWVMYNYVLTDVPESNRGVLAFFFGGIAGVILFGLLVCAADMTSKDLKEDAKKPKKEKKTKGDKSWLNS